MQFYKSSIDLWVLLVGKKKVLLQKDIIIIVLFIIYLPYANMHSIRHHLVTNLNEHMHASLKLLYKCPLTDFKSSKLVVSFTWISKVWR